MPQATGGNGALRGRCGSLAATCSQNHHHQQERAFGERAANPVSANTLGFDPRDVFRIPLNAPPLPLRPIFRFFARDICDWLAVADAPNGFGGDCGGQGIDEFHTYTTTDDGFGLLLRCERYPSSTSNVEHAMNEIVCSMTFAVAFPSHHLNFGKGIGGGSQCEVSQSRQTSYYFRFFCRG